LALLDWRREKRLKRDAALRDGCDNAASREENWYGSRAGGRQRRGPSGTRSYDGLMDFEHQVVDLAAACARIVRRFLL
jgi:hypothetical protein